MNPQNILILGFGVSGRAAATFLLKQGYRVIASDQKADAIRESSEIPIGLHLQREELVSFEGISQVILSPGIPFVHPLVQRAVENNIEVIGEIEFAFRHINNPCIGVTGSNGKTTTVLLIAHLLNCAGRKARALGNVGTALSSYLLNPDPEEILVVELSSFQLMHLQSQRLDIAAILNISPNHLDRHASMEEYVAAKLSIQNGLKSQGKLFVSRQVVERYGRDLNRAPIVFDSSPIAQISSVQYIKLGVPEKENVQAAFALAREFGLTNRDLERGLEHFRKPPHRIEWVADICGISYYNDSKSSNIDSVMHAVKLFPEAIILIVGGKDKGCSYRPWIESFKGKVKRMIAYGEAAAKIENELSKYFSFERKEKFQDAVLSACAAAKEQDVVLLSPGCSSYDQFHSYEHRGETFKRIIKEVERNGWIEKKQS